MSARRVALPVLALAGLVAATLSVGRAGTDTPTIRVDQLGYRPGDPKVAIVAGRVTGPFSVKRLPGREGVFDGETSALSPRDPVSGDQVSLLDFSALPVKPLP